jgi:hypothetical protein
MADSSAAKAIKLDPKAEPTPLAGFSQATAGRGRFVLTCSRAGRIDGRIEAYVNGIPIGRSADCGLVESGAEIAVNCGYFPNVGLPCQVRFAGGPGAVDAAPPVVLRTPAEVERLVGAGQLEEVRIAVRNGAIQGAGVNRVNGLGRPLLLGRVNGDLLREVKVETPRMREEGGASLAFTLAIEPPDLTESGAHYEILALPEMTVLASLSFPREDAGALAAAVARTDSLVTGMAKRLDLELARAAELADRRAGEQRALIDGVVEYLVALVYDRFADKSDPRAAALEDETLKGFRQAMDEVSHGRTMLDRLDYGAVRPDTAYFADGWSWVEQDSKGFDFRWMGLGGTVFNPQPHRPVEQVTVSIGTTYRGVEPQISALFDADPADIELVASPSGAPYTLKLLPRSGGRARPVQVLRLTSTTAGRPSEDGMSDDQRVLSIAVNGVTFYYG